MSQPKRTKKEFKEKFPIPLMHHVSRKKMNFLLHG